MVYKVVPTVVTGDYWTAGQNNTYIRDNFKATLPDLWTAAGQMVYATTSTESFGLLTIGTYPNRLTVNAGATAPEWVTPQVNGILLTYSGVTNPSVDDDWFPVSFGTKVYDGGSYYDSTSTYNQIKIPADGIYQTSGYVYVSLGTYNQGTPKARIGPDDHLVWSAKGSINGGYPIGTFCIVRRYAANDLIYLEIYNPYEKAGFTLREARLSVRYLGVST